MSLKFYKKDQRFRFRRSKISVKFSFRIWLLLALLITEISAVILEEDQPPPPQYANFFDYRCFPDNENTATVLNLRQLPVGLQVSDRVTHQLMTRIFAILMRDKLNYRNISLIPLIPLTMIGNTSFSDFEAEKLDYILQLIRHHDQLPDIAMVNLGVWMPSVAHHFVPTTVFDAGPSISPGRFGWFVPKANDDVQTSFESHHYTIFLNQSHINYERYVIDPALLQNLSKYADAEFNNPICLEQLCATLLAEYKYDTGFIESEIRNTSSYLNVLWLGSHFREQLKWLHEFYQQNDMYRSKTFIVLHWTPSDVIDESVGIKFNQIIQPRCEEFGVLEESLCKYEYTPVLKYFSKSLFNNGKERLIPALREFKISDKLLHELLVDVNKRRQGSTASLSDLYNEVACDWVKRHEHGYLKWISKEPTDKILLYIGGIFPITETSRGHQNLVSAVRLAVNAINRNKTVLGNYNLEVSVNDGQCKADLVLKAFIHYFNVPNVLGVLGPACSETVEPIAGISKHTNMAVISYSAEGASFADRQAYPFFFRTIGSNRQYEDAYIRLMQRLGWRRVAALTEDGQKYTEYISHMEASMKKHNLELVMNKKFQSDVTAAVMNKHLLDLKRKHAKIIIADVHNRNAELALCEASKLGMTAYEGYVWFLPSWLSKDWLSSTNRFNDSCSSENLQKAFDGHFSIMHTPFAEPTAEMQEQIPVKIWLENYKADNENISNYIGFAYDAVWAYALAADNLLKENKDAFNSLRSQSVINRFVDLIWETDFEGLSGRVRFGQGGSRITELKIMQWRHGQFSEVGTFMPELAGNGRNLHTNGGRLNLRVKAIEWLSRVQPPGDGTYDCNFSTLAELLNTDCDKAAVIFTAILCFLAVVVVSLVSFLFWKQRYDSKLKVSAKIMKNFGIDLLSPSRSKLNTLDKWEVPKEDVVVNRRLGEGAFGTVYGGEAQLNGDGWTAVAVKTLKAGASTEDRLDFLSEAEAMKRFDHKNIVKLLGVCLQSEPIYTIMEFMLYGDLKTYLLARRHLVNEKIGDESDISSKRLTICAMDVARGLSYLAQQKYVHRDIACRNCLVNAQRVVKLGDFGMARPTFESDYYRFNRKGMLPVRWMAPESLALGMFTPASDVWAFGVVLYEIITFGSFPYQGLTNNQVLEYVKSGKTLQIPSGVKPHLEGLIKACWSQDVKKRPTATEIVDYISNCSRLLSPCLDFPGASVEMPETESDELELLPKTRKCSPNRKDSTLDILSATNNFEATTSNEFADGMEMPEHTYVDIKNEHPSAPATTSADAFSPITPDGYSIMSPLLMHQVSESSDSSQTRLLQISPPEALQQTPF